MPAKAGIHDFSMSRQGKPWIPAFAGMTRGIAGGSILRILGIKRR
jgi:hypothetical protein